MVPDLWWIPLWFFDFVIVGKQYAFKMFLNFWWGAPVYPPSSVSVENPKTPSENIFQKWKWKKWYFQRYKSRKNSSPADPHNINVKESLSGRKKWYQINYGSTPKNEAHWKWELHGQIFTSFLVSQPAAPTPIISWGERGWGWGGAEEKNFYLSIIRTTICVTNFSSPEENCILMEV